MDDDPKSSLPVIQNPGEEEGVDDTDFQGGNNIPERFEPELPHNDIFNSHRRYTSPLVFSPFVLI